MDPGMREDFVGEEIAVESSALTGMPVSFSWRGRTYAVGGVVKAWQDWGFALDRAPRRQAWRARRHRNCYVISSEDLFFEIYRERGAADRWVLLKVKERSDR